MSYKDAAAICGTAEGTITSRVNRARIRLTELLGHEQTGGIEPDRLTKAALKARRGATS